MLGDLIDSIGKNFERLLRWVYPGALFLVLLYASKPNFFKNLTSVDNAIGIWGLVVGGLVAGVIVYLLQGYVVSYIINVAFMLLRWDVRQRLQCDHGERETESKKQPVSCVRWMLPLFDGMAAGTRERWSISDTQKLGNHLTYAWATYKAVLITGWLTIIFFGINESGSVFSSATAWAVLPPAILLLLGGLFTYLILSRIPVKNP